MGVVLKSSANCFLMPFSSKTRMNISPPYLNRKVSQDSAVSCLVYSSTLKMEAIYSSEKSGYLHTTRFYNAAGHT
jgi:hypothetical protein